jgi:hypothetical protein
MMMMMMMMAHGGLNCDKQIFMRVFTLDLGYRIPWKDLPVLHESPNMLEIELYCWPTFHPELNQSETPFSSNVENVVHMEVSRTSDVPLAPLSPPWPSPPWKSVR